VKFRRTVLALAAALMTLRFAGLAQASYTNGQLDRMQDLVDSGSWFDLRAFVEANPRLLEGGGVLAEMLAAFMSETESLYASLTFEESFFPNLSLVERLQVPAPTMAIY
jgi:hypothetical protein